MLFRQERGMDLRQQIDASLSGATPGSIGGRP